MGLVRAVVPESGVHVTVSEEWAESAGLEVVDEPATYHGRIVPPTTSDGRALKPRTTVEKAAKRAATKRGGAADKAEEAPK